MHEIRPIRTERDYEEALARVETLVSASLDSAEGRELDVLVGLGEAYEDKHFPMECPSPVAAIEFCMDQRGLGPRDLVPYIGSSRKVSEVLSGKRQITISMARALHEELGIPAESLLGGSSMSSDDL